MPQRSLQSLPICQPTANVCCVRTLTVSAQDNDKPKLYTCSFEICPEFVTFRSLAQSVLRVGYGLDSKEFQSRLEQGILYSSDRQDRLWGSTSLLFDGYRAYFPGLKWPEHEDNLRPSSAKVKKEWSYTSTSPIYLHGVARDIFTF